MKNVKRSFLSIIPDRRTNILSTPLDTLNKAAIRLSSNARAIELSLVFPPLTQDVIQPREISATLVINGFEAVELYLDLYIFLRSQFTILKGNIYPLSTVFNPLLRYFSYLLLKRKIIKLRSSEGTLNLHYRRIRNARSLLLKLGEWHKPSLQLIKTTP